MGESPGDGGREERPLQAVCLGAGHETGDIVVEDRKE